MTKTLLQRNAHSILIGTLSVLMLGACASVNRVKYPASANPTEEVSKLEQEMDQAVLAQQDVLAPKEIKAGQKHLQEAKEELADKDLNEFWDELGTAKAYLDRAAVVAEARQGRVSGVLEARQTAIDSGARRFESTRKELYAQDESFRKNAAELDRGKVDMDVWQRAMINYAALNVNTVREAQLKEARDLITAAKKRGARSYAPKTLAEAEEVMNAAEKAIASQPDNPAVFAPLVTIANDRARALVAVNATARKASRQTNEQVAREIVGRNQALTSLQSELQGADSEAAAARAALEQKDRNMRGLAAANVGLRSEQEWNQAIEDARAEFDQDEAEVYRQGDQLLIRLKAINFPTGSAQVPKQSEELLGKVSSVIEELNAKNVEIQGHTDSTGSPAINKKISQQRAEAVAHYLEDEVEDVDLKTVGYGFEKPIAANRSKKGRAENRRVDVVITPQRVEQE